MMTTTNTKSSSFQKRRRKTDRLLDEIKVNHTRLLAKSKSEKEERENNAPPLVEANIVYESFLTQRRRREKGDRMPQSLSVLKLWGKNKSIKIRKENKKIDEKAFSSLSFSENENIHLSVTNNII